MRLRRSTDKATRPTRRRAATVERTRRIGRGLACGAALLAAVGLLGAGWWSYRDRPWLQAEGTARSVLLDLSTAAGLTVRQVYLVGRSQAPLPPLQEAVGVEPGMPILAFDPHAAREALLALPWVADAQVERRLPDHIVV